MASRWKIISHNQLWEPLLLYKIFLFIICYLLLAVMEDCDINFYFVLWLYSVCFSQLVYFTAALCCNISFPYIINKRTLSNVSNKNLAIYTHAVSCVITCIAQKYNLRSVELSLNCNLWTIGPTVLLSCRFWQPVRCSALLLQG